MALYFRECFSCLELSDGNNSVEFLCIKTRGKTNKADVMVGGWYRPPKLDEEAEEIFYFYYKLILLFSAGRSLRIPGPCSLEEFGFPDICWEYNSAKKKQSRRFLGCVKSKSLMQMVREPTKGGICWTCFL